MGAQQNLNLMNECLYFFLFEDLKDGLSETVDLLSETKLFSFIQRKKGKFYVCSFTFTKVIV